MPCNIGISLRLKLPASEIITIAILACHEFEGNMRKALKFVQESRLFSFPPSESRFDQWLYSLRDIPPPIFSLLQAFHRKYFHGLKLHLLIFEKGFIKEFLILSGSWHDVTGLHQMAINLLRHLFADRAYTDYLAEDLLKLAERIKLFSIRKRNSRRFSPHLQYLYILKRRIVEAVGSCINDLFPKRIPIQLPWKDFSLSPLLFCTSLQFQSFA